MNKRLSLMCGVLLTMSCMNAYAASPLPSFDKTAVTEYPYYRTGEQTAEVDKSKDVLEYQPGNTGTAEHPAFL